MHPHIVNSSTHYGKVGLIDPTPLGYICAAASVEPGPIPLTLPSGKRSRLLARLKTHARRLEQMHEVVEASVFRAVVMPPTVRFSSYLQKRRSDLHIADFGVAILIETTSPAAARAVKETPAFGELMNDMRSQSTFLHSVAARNVKRIGNPDMASSDLFLFNHFAADDRDLMVELWEYLADWYTEETGLDNSIALLPIEDGTSEYAIINWAEWHVGPMQHFWHQLSKQSFWTYVTANLEANKAGSMPIYMRLVS